MKECPCKNMAKYSQEVTYLRKLTKLQDNAIGAWYCFGTDQTVDAFKDAMKASLEIFNFEQENTK